MVDALNAAGIPTATRAKWYASTVSYVLHNGFYAGLVGITGKRLTAGIRRSWSGPIMRQCKRSYTIGGD